MKQVKMSKTLGLVGGLLLVAGCSAGDNLGGYADSDSVDEDGVYGTAEEAICTGDNGQNDYNSMAASLATAVANELHEWDTANDFVVTSGKLALSSTALATCGTGCTNTKDLLLLQNDATAGTIPGHDPVAFRTNLVNWYNANMKRLTELAYESRLPPGTYQLKNKNSGKNIVMDGSKLTDGAVAEQNVLAGTAGNWTVAVEGTKWRIKNQNSGKCLDLASASSADNVNIVQRTCSTTSNTQLFEFIKDPGGLYAVKTYYGKYIIGFNWGTGNDVPMVQGTWMTGNSNGQFSVAPVGATTNPATTIFKGMYTLKFANTYSTAVDSNLVAAPISTAEGAAVKLASYSSSNRLHNWYATIVNGKYQFVNRGSGKCLALATDTSTALLVQKTCAVNDSQLFTAGAQTPAEEYTLKTRYNTLLEAQNAGSAAGVAIAQTATTIADPQRRIKFSPIMAAEPHKLTFDHISSGAACGSYYWYNITQPSGAPVSDPMSTYIDLIFAGGKTTYSGTDINPYISQQSSGTQVAIDPAGYMTGGTGAAGTCATADVFYDATKMSAGACCVKSTGVNSTFKVSSWSTTTFLCQ
jgi:hypothetical protein